MLLGENGAGKSTLDEDPQRRRCARTPGEIELDGQAVEIAGPAPRAGAAASAPSTRSSTWCRSSRPPRTSSSAASRSALRRGRPQARSARRPTRLLDGLGVAIDPDTPVRAARRRAAADGGGGEGAVATSARILIMDEPTSALTDAEIGAALRGDRAPDRARRRRSSTSRTAWRRSTRIGAPRHRPARRPPRGHLRRRRDASPAELIRLMADRELSEHFPRRRGAPGEELLRVEDLGRGGALRDVSFTPAARRDRRASPGCSARAAPSWRGRSWARTAPTAGRVLVEGRELRAARRRADAIARGIGLLPEDRKTQGLVLGLSVQAQPRAAQRCGACRRFGVVDARRARPRWRRRRSTTCASRPRASRSRWRSSRGGNQQKVRARASGWPPSVDVLIMDEPTRGIDVAAKVEIYELMNRLTARGRRDPDDLVRAAGGARHERPHPGACAGAASWREFDAAARPRSRCWRAALGQAVVSARAGGAGASRGPPSWARSRACSASASCWRSLTPYFLTVSNLLNVMEQTSINAVIAVGMTFVILSGGIDLSVGSLRRARPAWCWRAALQAPAAPLPLAILAGLAAGAACGLVQRPPDHARPAAAVHRHARHDERRARPGAARSPTAGRSPASRRASARSPPGASLGDPGAGAADGRRLRRRALRADAHPLRPLRLRDRRQRGGDAALGRRGRASTRRWSTCCPASPSALAAVLLTARLNSAQPIAGMMYELDAIAATVIGGTSLLGGSGTRRAAR